MAQSPHFTGKDMFEQFDAWVQEQHPNMTIHIGGYYVPTEGGLYVYYEVD